MLRGGHGFFATDVFCHGCFATDFFATDEHGFSRIFTDETQGVGGCLGSREAAKSRRQGRVVQGVWFVKVVFDFLPLRNC